MRLTRLISDARFVMCLLPAMLACPHADAAITVDMMEYTGSDMIGRAVFEQVGDDIQVTLSTVQEPGHPNTGDWGGFWFNVSDDSVLAGLTVTGADVTAFDFSGGVGSVGGSNNNLNGGGSSGAMDAGIAFGQPGSASGLLDMTVFTLSHVDGLTLSLFEHQTVAGRLQTVGPAPNGGGDSSKIKGVTGENIIPEPASLALATAGVLMIVRRRDA